jgi:hypothetical protein
VKGYALYWLIWFGVLFVSFIVPELIALFSNPRNTLSWTLWNLEQVVPGSHQPVWQWTALHVLIGGVLAVLLVWLIGHLVFGIWA